MKINQIFLIIILMFSTIIHGEYLVFEKLGNQIKPISSPEKYAKIYPILMKYQWPMSIASFAQMTKDEISELTTQKKPAAEEEFIRKRLKALDQNLDILFIPTTTYELFVIYYYYKIRNIAKEKKSLWQNITKYISFFQNGLFGSGPYFTSNSIETKLKSKKIVSRQDLLNEFKVFNNNKKIQQAYYIINNSLLNYIEIDPKLLTTQNFIELSKKIIEFIRLEKKITSGSIHSISEIFYRPMHYIYLEKDFANPPQLEDIITSEYKAHQENKGLLFRATRKSNPFFMPGKSELSIPLEPTILFKGNVFSYTPVTSEQLKAESKFSLKDLNQKYKYINWNAPTRSISYGNSLFAGYFLDDTACVYSYLIEGIYKILYTLSLNKYSYGILSQLFFISPLNTIVAMFSHGELFHSRTISYYKDYQEIKSLFEGSKIDKAFLVSGLQSEKINFLLGFFIRKGDSLKNAYDLSDFISKHASILTTAPDISKAKLLEGQEDLTNLLKLMLSLRAHLPQIKKTLGTKKSKLSKWLTKKSKGLKEILEN